MKKQPMKVQSTDIKQASYEQLHQ